MIKILGCVFIEHDLALVGLAALVCVFSSFTLSQLFGQARDARGQAQWLWTMAAGAAAGSGIWATHFIAMLAYKTSLPLTFDFKLTLLSIVVAVVLAILAVAAALRLNSGAAGGILLGGAIGAMHFTGMAALGGPIELAWNWVYVAASLVLGAGLGAAALSIAMTATTVRGALAVTALLTLAICSLHFTAMTAVTVTPVGAEILEGYQGLGKPGLAMAIAAVALLIMGLGMVNIFVLPDDGLTAPAHGTGTVSNGTHAINPAQSPVPANNVAPQLPRDPGPAGTK